MSDDRFIPLTVGGSGTAVGFKIPDLDLLPGDMRGVDGEDIFLPGDRQLGGGQIGESENE